MEEFGLAKLEFFRSFLKLPHGIPSHDTLGRVFEALDSQALERCLLNWSAALSENLAGEVVALGGKTLRRSLDRRSGQNPLHVVSAWAADSGLRGMSGYDAGREILLGMPPWPGL